MPSPQRDGHMLISNTTSLIPPDRRVPYTVLDHYNIVEQLAITRSTWAGRNVSDELVAKYGRHTRDSYQTYLRDNLEKGAKLRYAVEEYKRTGVNPIKVAARLQIAGATPVAQPTRVAAVAAARDDDGDFEDEEGDGNTQQADEDDPIVESSGERSAATGRQAAPTPSASNAKLDRLGPPPPRNMLRGFRPHGVVDNLQEQLEKEREEYERQQRQINDPESTQREESRPVDGWPGEEAEPSGTQAQESADPDAPEETQLAQQQDAQAGPSNAVATRPRVPFSESENKVLSCLIDDLLFKAYEAGKLQEEDFDDSESSAALDYIQGLRGLHQGQATWNRLATHQHTAAEWYEHFQSNIIAFVESAKVRVLYGVDEEAATQLATQRGGREASVATQQGEDLAAEPNGNAPAPSQARPPDTQAMLQAALEVYTQEFGGEDVIMAQIDTQQFVRDVETGAEPQVPQETAAILQNALEDFLEADEEEEEGDQEEEEDQAEEEEEEEEGEEEAEKGDAVNGADVEKGEEAEIIEDEEDELRSQSVRDPAAEAADLAEFDDGGNDVEEEDAIKSQDDDVIAAQGIDGTPVGPGRAGSAGDEVGDISMTSQRARHHDHKEHMRQRRKSGPSSALRRAASEDEDEDEQISEEDRASPTEVIMERRPSATASKAPLRPPRKDTDELSESQSPRRAGQRANARPRTRSQKQYAEAAVGQTQPLANVVDQGLDEDVPQEVPAARPSRTTRRQASEQDAGRSTRSGRRSLEPRAETRQKSGRPSHKEDLSAEPGIPRVASHADIPFHDFSRDEDALEEEEEEDTPSVSSRVLGKRRAIEPDMTVEDSRHNSSRSFRTPASTVAHHSRPRTSAASNMSGFDSRRAENVFASSPNLSFESRQREHHHRPRPSVSASASRIDIEIAKQKYRTNVLILCRDFGLASTSQLMPFLVAPSTDESRDGRAHSGDLRQARRRLERHVDSIASEYGVTRDTVVDYVRECQGSFRRAEKFLQIMARESKQKGEGQRRTSRGFDADGSVIDQETSGGGFPRSAGRDVSGSRLDRSMTGMSRSASGRHGSLLPAVTLGSKASAQPVLRPRTSVLRRSVGDEDRSEADSDIFDLEDEYAREAGQAALGGAEEGSLLEDDEMPPPEESYQAPKRRRRL